MGHCAILYDVLTTLRIPFFHVFPKHAAEFSLAFPTRETHVGIPLLG